MLVLVDLELLVELLELSDELELVLDDDSEVLVELAEELVADDALVAVLEAEADETPDPPVTPNWPV